MADRIGQQFGNYRLTELIGSGGYADVYLAEHLYISNLRQAIKVLKETEVEEHNQDEFLLEARMIANLQRFSSHIVQISDVGIQVSKESGGPCYTPYIIMEYASHGTLRGLYRAGTWVPLERVAFYTKQIAEALQCAHEQHPPIIHRDIKPENMLLRTEDHVLLSDFGISISGKTGPQKRSNEKNVVGTAAYIAPERITGHMRRASDQYSLAIVVYEWISGERPFDGTDKEICAKHLMMPPPPLYPTYPRVTQDLGEVVERALQKKPEDRYPDVRTFALALEKAITSARRGSQTLSLPAVAEQKKDTAQFAMSQTLPAPSATDTEITHKALRIPAMTTGPTDVQQNRIIVSSAPDTATELVSNQQIFVASAVSPRALSEDRENFFEFSSQFERDPRSSFFRGAGIICNILVTVIMGLLLQNFLVLFGGLLVSWLLFTLCVRAVEENLALFFGFLLACYWACAGFIGGRFLAVLLNLNILPTALFIGALFFLASLSLHVRYVAKKNV
jgi:serine/threonine protein kinase